MMSGSNEQLAEEENESMSSDSATFVRSVSSDSVGESPRNDEMNDYIQELKAELHRHCQLDWLEKFEPWKHNPKVELNLLLNGAEPSASMKESIERIIQNDDCVVQRIFQSVIHRQREQRIIYTELLFRPELFHFQPKASGQDLQRCMNILISCIRASTTTDKKEKPIRSGRTNESFLPYITQPLPFHMKIILSCRWHQVAWLPEFIHLIREFPDEIVGIDVYGSEDECRDHWQTFLPYRKLVRQHHLAWQANIGDCTDEQLLLDVVQGLDVQRLSETYGFLPSRRSVQDILIKHGVHLVVCPTSPSYTKVNAKVHRAEPISPYTLMHRLQSDHLNYSISSLSPAQYQQNLVQIYRDLLNSNPHSFTCEHMQWWNEDALKSSFASQKLKTTLLNYLRANYAKCHQQTILLQQFQESTKRWEQEMGHLIDTNVRTAMDLAMKMRKENLLPPTPDGQRFDAEQMGEEEEEEEEVEEVDQIEE